MDDNSESLALSSNTSSSSFRYQYSVNSQTNSSFDENDTNDFTGAGGTLRSSYVKSMREKFEKLMSSQQQPNNDNNNTLTTSKIIHKNKRIHNFPFYKSNENVYEESYRDILTNHVNHIDSNNNHNNNIHDEESKEDNNDDEKPIHSFVDNVNEEVEEDDDYRNKNEEIEVENTEYEEFNGAAELKFENEEDEQQHIYEDVEVEAEADIESEGEEVVEEEEEATKGTNDDELIETNILENNDKITLNDNNVDKFISDNEDDDNNNDAHGFEMDNGQIIEARNDDIYSEVESNPDADYSDSFNSDDEEDLEIMQLQDPLLSIGSLPNIISHLLENENTYICTLKTGIDKFISVMDDKKLPATLYGQKRAIFCNIDIIYEFHVNEFYPALLECNNDVAKLGEVFCKYIQQNSFYKYVWFAINRPRSEDICKRHKEFFEMRVDDKLGINSFLTQPIQRLPKYKLLWNDIIKELSKNIEQPYVKELIASSCRAEKQVQRLLDRVNESMHINDIDECYDINLLQQGMFIKVDEMQIYDWDQKRRYRGRVFLFDKTLIYTETIDKDVARYRGHFPRDLMGIERQEKNKFTLFETKRGKHDVEFTTDNVDLWYELIRDVLLKFVEDEKNKIFLRKNQNRNRLPSTYVNDRGDSFRTSSNSTGSSYRSSTTSGSTVGSHDSHSIRSSTIWYIPDIDNENTEPMDEIDSLRKIEKDYIDQILSNRKTYFPIITEQNNNINNHLINKFIIVLNKIIRFHIKIFYPQIIQAEDNIMLICKLFEKYFEEFDLYYYYACMIDTVERHLQNYCKYSELSDCDTLTLSFNKFLLLPIKHINRYVDFFEILFQKMSHNIDNGQQENFKMIAVQHIKLQNLQKRLKENYQLYSMKKFHFDITQWGIVLNSELIQINNINCRLLILKNCLVCVRMRTNATNNIEHYYDINFSILLNSLEIRKSINHPKRLKVSEKNMETIVYRLNFVSQDRRNTFTDTLLKYKNQNMGQSTFFC